MSRDRVRHAILKQLVLDGVDTIFGNPGTFEQGLLDAIRECPGIRYVLGLQEAVVIAMATNYARLGRRGSVVQLHAGVGLGNAMGALQEAKRGEVPMLILCGENATDLEAFDGYLAWDLVELARPVTKWATRVASPSQSLRILRRAWSRALTPPRGPVLLSFPMDVLEGPAVETPIVTVLPETRTTPDPAVIREMAEGLLRATHPVLLVGDDLAWSGAETEALEVAALIGAPVCGLNLTMAGHLLAHPSFRGILSHTASGPIVQALASADAVLSIGATLGTEIFPRPRADYLPKGVPLYQIDPNPAEIGKNVAATIGVVADPKGVLASMARVLREQRATPAVVPPLPPILSATGTTAHGFTAESMMTTLARLFPSGALVLDEAMSATEHLRRALQNRPDVDYLSCLSRGIGSGWPGGVAAKLLHPQRPVIAISADGAAMYVSPSLWTAAHLKLDVIFVACNNRSYQVLKRNISDYWERTGQPSKPFPFMDMDDPPIAFDRMGESMGLTGWRATDERSLESAFRHALEKPGPHVIDVVLEA